MQVIFKRNAFIEGSLYRWSTFPQEVPETLRDKLPTSAKIVEKYVPKVEDKPAATLRDFDLLRPAAEAEKDIRAKVKREQEPK